MSIRAILGGTFNPPHLGHIQPALYLLDYIKVNTLGLMPCKIAPHKPVSVSEAHRVEMVKLACELDKRLYPELIELSLPSPSYTVRTLENLRQHHADTICFFIGADSLYNIQSWFEWERLLDYCHLVVMRREGDNFEPPSSLTSWLNANKTEDINQLHHQPNGCVLLVNTPLPPASSTQIRDAVSATTSALTPPIEWLPTPVADYINMHHLYQDKSN